jgi:hypothetical protein
MAISKTSTISEIVVTPAKSTDKEETDNDSHPVITINTFDTYIDDATDAVNNTLVSTKIYKFTDGSPTDVTGEDSMVQGIASFIWS